ncbi:MAG: hypothetical protein ACJ8AP_00545, partial [Gemmatimonadales bacterium]
MRVSVRRSARRVHVGWRLGVNGVGGWGGRFLLPIMVVVSLTSLVQLFLKDRGRNGCRMFEYQPAAV